MCQKWAFLVATCSRNTIKFPAGWRHVLNVLQVVHRYDLLSYLVKKIEVWERQMRHMVDFYLATCSGNLPKCPAGGGLVHNIEEVLHLYSTIVLGEKD